MEKEPYHILHMVFYLSMGCVFFDRSAYKVEVFKMGFLYVLCILAARIPRRVG